MDDGVDVLVAGAGLAGTVTARRLAEEFGLRCLVVERRDRVGGLCHDAPDPHGVLVPSHGPHWFRTDSARVRSFLHPFTAWREVAFRVLVHARGRDWSFPVNLATFEQYLGRPSTKDEMEATLAAWRVPDPDPRDSEAFVLSRVGRPFFELFYEGYTRKQWGREARDLLPAACGRIPIRTDRDDRYLSKGFQAMPADGYTPMFRRLLDHPGIEVRLSTRLEDVRSEVRHRHLVYTGPVDAYFGHDLGPLPWRGLRWERETFPADFVQPAMQVNYPDQHEFTRIIEPKHATGQVLPVTTIVREYPYECEGGQDPCYAIPSATALEQYRRYAVRAAATPGVTFLGRFAEYRNLDMDQVVLRALGAADRLGARLLGERGARSTGGWPGSGGDDRTLPVPPPPGATRNDDPGTPHRPDAAPGTAAPSTAAPGTAAPGLAAPLPLRRRRDPREAPPAVGIEVVVARYREPVDWLRNVPSSARVTVYDKGGDLDPRRLPWARVERLPNVGNEAHSFLHHLATRYDELAPVTFFCQGHPFDHAFDLHPVLRNVAAGVERVDGFRWLGFVIDTDDPRGRRLFVPWSKNRDGRELALDDFHRQLFGQDPPDRIPFTLGGQFALTDRQARSRPREFYVRALELARSFPDAAHCFERFWDRVFGTVGVDPWRLGGAQRVYLRSVRSPRA